jgi:hypothetical protein
VSAVVIEFQESILDFDLRRDVASVKNVTDPNSILGQSPSDEETTVTIERIVFRAQERNAIVLCTLNNTAQSVAKLLGLCHLLVVSHPVAVELGSLGRPPSSLPRKTYKSPSRPSLSRNSSRLK